MTHPHSLTIAAAQYPIDKPDSLTEWQDKIRKWVAEGVETGADLLVFPEYAAIEQAACFGPEVYGDLSETLIKVAELADERVAFHASLAQDYNVHILVGSGPICKTDGRVVNAAQLVGPKGDISAQEKLIMTPFEHDWGVSAGGPVRVFETAIGVIGVAICYDSEFPLLARSMAEAGAELLLVPSCTERLSGYARVRTGSMARALENTIVVAHSPTVGDAPWSPAVDANRGAAGIYVPSEHGISDTGILGQGILNQPQWVTATVDMDRLRRVRASGEMRNFADWDLQPGAPSSPVAVERVTVF